MKTLIAVIAAMLMSVSTAKAADLSYEINQPFECVMTQMSLPGADEIITEKSGGVLVSKDLRVAGFVWTKKECFISLTYETVVQRPDRKLRFRDVTFLKKGEVVTTTELVGDGGRLTKYLLTTRITRVGRNKTVVEHDLELAVDGYETGLKALIVRRVSLRKAEAGIRAVLGEPRPEED